MQQDLEYWQKVKLMKSMPQTDISEHSTLFFTDKMHFHHINKLH